jgi:methylmalonyl-CoA carboxyltransferase large subunit
MNDLRTQMSALNERLAQLEERAAGARAPISPAEPERLAAPAAAGESAPEALQERIPPEILLAISAAVAAYLGERAHVRAVRLIGTTRWSQEGRVSIQASHYLNRG